MRGRDGDEQEREHAEDRELEVTRSILSVYEFRFGTPPPELVAVLEEAADLAGLTQWLSRVSRSSAAEITAELKKAQAAPKRRSVRTPR